MRTSEKQKWIILWDKTPFPNIVFSEQEAPAQWGKPLNFKDPDRCKMPAHINETGFQEAKVT